MNRIILLANKWMAHGKLAAKTLFVREVLRSPVIALIRTIVNISIIGLSSLICFASPSNASVSSVQDISLERSSHHHCSQLAGSVTGMVVNGFLSFPWESKW